VNLRRPSRRTLAAVRIVALATVLVATACTSTRSPYLLRRDEIPVHVVERGETLYKIAWQHRVDERDLIAWNAIRDPAGLRVGQRLRLANGVRYVAPPVVPPAAPPVTVSSPRPTTARTPSGASTSRSTPPRAKPPATRAVTPPPRPAPVATAPTWSWPTDGRIVANFGANGGISSGIAIGGREGQPVRAAAAGRVVYAGGGLIGYGQLVIIKHDDVFLSAYGYNSNLLVTQGQEVARGTTIALMGQGPERQPRLHFEIRRNGVPVDPLLFVAAPR